MTQISTFQVSNSHHHLSDDGWYPRQMVNALRMARAYHHDHKRRVVWQERAADYRETIIYRMRRRQGWTLLETIAGKRTR